MAESAELLIDRYRLVDRIGRGGMGSVWRGYDEFLRRAVAVKEIHLPDELDDAERFERLSRVVREARAAARLRHPGVVSVYDVVDQDDRPWIIMELVESRSLEEIIRNDGALPVERTAKIGLRLLDALQAAHRAGVIHRDIKPGNVLIGTEGRVVLSDFGIATYDGASTLTRSGTFLGSPAYIAPEVARGERATPASDLWSLGATLYAAVEGHPPYERNTAMATLGALLTQDPDPPKRAGLLRPAIDGLLRKQPARRLSIRRARGLLAHALADNRTRSHWLARNWPMLVGVTVLMAGIVAAAAILAATRADNTRRPPVTTPSGLTSPTAAQSTHARRESPVAALTVRCQAARCGVFISALPGNEVLFNGNLGRSEVRSYNEPRMALVIRDSSSIDVFINGKLQPKGSPGERKTYRVVKA